MVEPPSARVLVVDDEEHIRRLVRAILSRLTRKYGVKVTEAANVDEALRVLAAGDAFHLVVSDHSMPGRSGIDLLAEVHEKYPNTARILVTALDQLDIGVEAINRGRVDAFLRKPWQNDAFIALADSLLAQRVGNRDGSADRKSVV
jgi:DNA-binding NtrC family response regulator